MADFSLNIKVNGAEQVVTTVGEIEDALRATNQELKNTAIGSAEFGRLSEQAQTLQREFVNSYKEATNFNRGIAELGQSVGSLASTVTAGFTIATSAFQLFGSETEELSQTQIKAQQALALALSATTIATNAKTIAEDINNVGVALSNGLAKALTLALGQQTIATAAQAVAAGTATVAQRALNAAMAANPVGLVVAAVTTLIGAFALLGSEEKKTYTYTRDLNQEIDNNTKVTLDNIAAQRELIQIQGNLKEAQATTEMARLEARLDTQRQLDQLDVKAVRTQQKNVDDQIRLQQAAFTYGATFVEMEMERTKELQDFNLESRLNAEQKEYASLIRQRENGIITYEQYTEKVVEVYKRFYKTQDEERAKEFNKQVQDLDALMVQRNKLALDLEVATKNESANEEIANEEKKKQREKDYKDYKDNLDKRKAELESYNKDVEKLDKDREKRIQDLERKLQDFQLERISLVKDADGNFREDLIAGYDETISKLGVERDRNLADEKKSFEESLKNFEETEKKRVDAKGRRIVSDEAIDKQIDDRRKLFDEEQLLREQTYNQQIIAITDERASKVKEIETILATEVAFGDNNLADTRLTIAAEVLNTQIEFKRRELELERQGTFDKIALGEEERKNRIKGQIELLKEIQKLELDFLKAQRKAAIEQNQISQAEDLKNIQGTEDQKAKQREEILKIYKEKELQINADYDLKEKEQSRKALSELAQARIENLQKIVDFIANIANTVTGLFSSINELNRVQLDEQLKDLQYANQQQEAERVTQYNKDLANLEQQYQQGLISEQAYNEGQLSLKKNLDNSKKAADKQLRDREYAEKKKAFDQEKKLKIAQAIIAGIQGAVSAFTGAFQLGPIAGPIVGAVLAALVAATTAVQVAAISKTTFDKPPVDIPDVATAGGGGGAGGAVTQASAGGFTGFNQGLVGAPTGTGAQFTPITGSQNQRVYVVESDITGSQNRVRTLESNATFG